MKRTLLAARSITNGRGAGSEHFEKVLERLGITNEVKSKTVRGEPGDTGIRVANGEAEIGVTLLQVLMPVAGSPTFASRPRPLARRPNGSVSSLGLTDKGRFDHGSIS